MSDKTQEGYKTAFKATALFGGVQVFTILIKILNSKVIALWLGTTGYGIMSLFNSTTTLISSITNLGLQSSAVRDIAIAHGTNDTYKVAQIVKAINRWVWTTGLVGALLTIALSPWLSQWVFENDSYTISFILLSCVVLLTGLYNANYAILQGTRRLKGMAAANVFGALSGFVCSLPIYYFFREKGIVCALILTALSTLIVSYFYVRKIALPKVNQTYKESFRIGRNTAKLGMAMAISGIMVEFVQFVVKTFITHQGGVADVGLYQAGWSLNGTYLGLVFTAMAKDYFPRLSQHADNNLFLNDSVNQQAEIAILILSPLIMIMVVFMPLFIRMLYTPEFLSIVELTTWLLIGSLVKAGSWGISFVFLAKGDRNIYLFNELGIKIITLPSYLLGYYWFGLNGIGYAFVFNYTIYFIWVVIVAQKKYELKYSKKFVKLFLFFLLLITVFPIAVYCGVNKYVVGIPLSILITAISIILLNKRIHLTNLLGHKHK